jgi:16S rRNA (uracil1498-N3)-methyltransferase
VTAPHFFVEAARALEPGGRVTLSEEDSRHALRSLRLRPGEMVTVADDEGRVARGTLLPPEDRRAVVQVEDVRRVVRRGGVVSVAMAPPKGDRLAWAVQKLGELGIDELALIHTERAVREWSGERAERVVDRLQLVAREAAMQSRRPFVMRVLPPVSLDEALAVGALVVVLWEGADTSLASTLSGEGRPIRLVIGPEGGFADGEIERARERGVTLASLGEGILRTETAAVAAATLALARYGRLG